MTFESESPYFLLESIKIEQVTHAPTEVGLKEIITTISFFEKLPNELFIHCMTFLEHRHLTLFLSLSKRVSKISWLPFLEDLFVILNKIKLSENTSDRDIAEIEYDRLMDLFHSTIPDFRWTQLRDYTGKTWIKIKKISQEKIYTPLREEIFQVNTNTNDKFGFDLGKKGIIASTTYFEGLKFLDKYSYLKDDSLCKFFSVFSFIIMKNHILMKLD